MQSGTRLIQLDGLRGIAALIVVVFHTAAASAHWLTPEIQSNAHWIGYSPLAVFFNGPFAVAIFFVLSGFVVTDATVRRGDPLWLDGGIRYLRLAVPALASCILAWALLTIWPRAATDLRLVLHSPWLAMTYQEAIPPLSTAIYEGLIGNFVTGESDFNNVLWTMRPELVGSLICFGIAALGSGVKRTGAALALLSLSLVLRQFPYLCFASGILLREAWVTGRLPRSLPLLAGACGLIIGSWAGDFASVVGLDKLPRALQPGNKSGILAAFGGLLIVYSSIRSREVADFLAGRAIRFLGRISFARYLVHVPLIYTILSASLISIGASITALLAVCSAFMVLVVLTAYCATVMLEEPFLQKLAQLRGWLRSVTSAQWLKPLP